MSVSLLTTVTILATIIRCRLWHGLDVLAQRRHSSSEGRRHAREYHEAQAADRGPAPTEVPEAHRPQDLCQISLLSVGDVSSNHWLGYPCPDEFASHRARQFLLRSPCTPGCCSACDQQSTWAATSNSTTTCH